MDPAPGRDRGQPDLAGRVAAPDHRARAPPRPPRRPARPRRQGRRRRHRQPSGPTRPGRPNGTPNDAWSSRNALDHDHEPVRDAMAAGQRLRGAGGGDRQGRRRAAGRAPPQRRSPPDRPGRRARPGRAAPARTPRPRSRRPRDRRSTRAQSPATPGSARRGSLPVHHRRRRARPVPRPVHPARHGGGDAQAGGARDQLTQAPPATPAPPRGSGTRSASTSPATRSTGSPRPAAWTPRSWSP